MKKITRRKFLATTAKLATGLYIATQPISVFASQNNNENPYIAYDFSKDSDQTLLAKTLCGESSSRIANKKYPEDKEPIMIGHTIINRIGTWQGKTLRDVLLKNGPVRRRKNKKIITDKKGIPILYHQFSCFNAWDPNLKKIKNPEKYYPRKTWEEALLISKRLLEGKLSHLNYGQTHYHTKTTNPSWAKSPRMKEVWGQPYFKHKFYKDTKA